MLYKNVSLATIAKHIDMSLEELVLYNPSLKRKSIPNNRDGYALTLPVSKVGLFEEKRDTIFYSAPKASVPTNTAATVHSKPPPRSTSKPTYQHDNSNETLVTYTVKSGDNLGYIAGWYDCSVNELKYWNSIRGSMIRVGQKVTVYVPKAHAERYRRVDGMSFAQKQAMVGFADKEAIKSESSGSSSSSDNYIYYTIKRGDSLWEISLKHPGNSVETIRRLNNLTSNSVLHPGDRIKLLK